MLPGITFYQGERSGRASECPLTLTILLCFISWVVRLKTALVVLTFCPVLHHLLLVLIPTRTRRTGWSPAARAGINTGCGRREGISAPDGSSSPHEEDAGGSNTSLNKSLILRVLHFQQGFEGRGPQRSWKLRNVQTPSVLQSFHSSG